jgi:hypothetical protein
MLIVILIGESKVQCIQHCDVDKTIQRHTQSHEDNNTIIDKLMRTMFRSSPKSPYVYYIMLTDGSLSSSNKEDTYFPGHVFIIEKTINQQYLIYQSFIGKYDLNDYIVKNKCKTYSLDKVKKMCFYFKKFLSDDYIWDEEAVNYWTSLTGVDTSKFMNHNTKNIYLCFKKFKLDSVKKKITKFISTSLNDINTSIDMNDLNKYNSDNHHHNQLSAKPYSIFELKTQIELLYKDVSII